MAASIVDLSERVLGKVAFANLSDIFHKRVIDALIKRLINDNQLIVTLKTKHHDLRLFDNISSSHEDS